MLEDRKQDLDVSTDPIWRALLFGMTAAQFLVLLVFAGSLSEVKALVYALLCRRLGAARMQALHGFHNAVNAPAAVLPVASASGAAERTAGGHEAPRTKPASGSGSSSIAVSAEPSTAATIPLCNENAAVKLQAAGREHPVRKELHQPTKTVRATIIGRLVERDRE